MREESKPVVLMRLDGKKELRGFAQFRGDGKWLPRAWVIRHLEVEGRIHVTPLSLADEAFDTEDEAALYGFNAAMIYSGTESI